MADETRAIAEAEIPTAAFPFGQHLLDTYASEINKVASVWRSFGDADLAYRPHQRSSTVADVLQHELVRAGSSPSSWRAGAAPADVLPADITVAARCRAWSSARGRGSRFSPRVTRRGGSSACRSSTSSASASGLSGGASSTRRTTAHSSPSTCGCSTARCRRPMARRPTSPGPARIRRDRPRRPAGRARETRARRRVARARARMGGGAVVPVRSSVRATDAGDRPRPRGVGRRRGPQPSEPRDRRGVVLVADRARRP